MLRQIYYKSFSVLISLPLVYSQSFTLLSYDLTSVPTLPAPIRPYRHFPIVLRKNTTTVSRRRTNTHHQCTRCVHYVNVRQCVCVFVTYTFTTLDSVKISNMVPVKGPKYHKIKICSIVMTSFVPILQVPCGSV